MLRVGITGGIGTGKSFVCNLFRFFNIPVYSADIRAKELCEEDHMIKARIMSVFGHEAYTENGKYNTKFIASKIFDNPDLRKIIESIVHPAVLKDSNYWFESLQKKSIYPYALKEAAILFESGSDKGLDKIIVVDAPLKVRLQRIVQRDQITEEQVLKRIEMQWPSEKKLALADYIIHNDGKKAVIPQVVHIHQELIKSNYRSGQERLVLSI